MKTSSRTGAFTPLPSHRCLHTVAFTPLTSHRRVHTTAFTPLPSHRCLHTVAFTLLHHTVAFTPFAIIPSRSHHCLRTRRLHTVANTPLPSHRCLHTVAFTPLPSHRCLHTVAFPEWSHRKGAWIPRMMKLQGQSQLSCDCTDLYYARGAQGVLPMRARVRPFNWIYRL